MYVTRKISQYLNNPQAAAEPPPAAPSSGILVIEDEEATERKMRCWGLYKDRRVYSLPFPQNWKLKVEYTTSTTTTGADGQLASTPYTDRDDVVFIPVMNQPLSSNRYYVVRADGRHIGKVSACSREEDMTRCCFCACPNDVCPRPFDHQDIYQQVEVVPLKRRNSFQAKAVAPDGIPPNYLRRKGWRIFTSSSTSYDLTEAPGMNSPLRDQMPELNFSIDTKCSTPVAVAKWYCPFVLVREGERLKVQVRKSMFYEMTLEQNWEQIYSCENHDQEGKKEVAVNVEVKRAMPLLNGTETVQEGRQVDDGVMWLRPVNSAAGGGVGLSMVLWERMRWELERGGWMSNGDVETVGRVERFEGEGRWEKFGCYVLVEKFVLRRLDGSLALTYEFKHTNKIRTKWV